MDVFGEVSLSVFIFLCFTFGGEEGDLVGLNHNFVHHVILNHFQLSRNVLSHPTVYSIGREFRLLFL